MNKKIVCLGGGIGTVNLVKGLKDHFSDISVVVSMADDGGSSGRLRRLYHIMPPGDLVSCMAAYVKNNDLLNTMLTYRFPGDRYGTDDALGGHKLGNLIMVALRDITGSYDEAILLFQKIFGIEGNFLPATLDEVSISAETVEGKKVTGEENIDLGKYSGKRILEKVFLHPYNASANPKAVEAILASDVIIAGPGDLYTTILPVLIIPDITKALLKKNASKIFVVNVANKPFETKGYSVTDYIKAIIKHIGEFPFQTIIVNNNTQIEIPEKYHYSYVPPNSASKTFKEIRIIAKDIVDEKFPLYHSPAKLAKTIIDAI